jgi:hypothetical protein
MTFLRSTYGGIMDGVAWLRRARGVRWSQRARKRSGSDVVADKRPRRQGRSEGAVPQREVCGSARPPALAAQSRCDHWSSGPYPPGLEVNCSSKPPLFWL